MGCSPAGSLFMEFSRQEYWSGVPFPSPGIEPISLAYSCLSNKESLPIYVLLGDGRCNSRTKKTQNIVTMENFYGNQGQHLLTTGHDCLCPLKSSR